MATDHCGFNIDLTLAAAADLSSYQYRFVRLTANDTVNVCSGATQVPIGVLQNKPSAAGAAAIVRTFGVSKVSGDDALTAGAAIGTSGDGQADAKVVGDVTEYVVGTVLVGTTAANGIAEATINCLNPTRAN